MVKMPINVVNLKYHVMTRLTWKVDRSTPLGNPYVIGEHGNRESVIKKYRKWLESIIKHKTSSEPYLYFLKLESEYEANRLVFLACHCKPKSCHADVIKELIEARYEAKKATTQTTKG